MPAEMDALLDPKHSEWPIDENEAVNRANLYRDHDPFPHKKAALLGSDDFLDYACVTGMIFPCTAFNKVDGKPDSERIKPASYEVRPGEKFFRYADDGTLIAVDLVDNADGQICLPANSISFVSTDEIFRLPNYIAMRFNLRIQHVHRGILLGTGPMVDPGFGKRILIPLHNLTDDDYRIPLKDGLIWVEFTKTSWTKPQHGKKNAHNVTLPVNTEKELREFLFHANQGRPIRSSISGFVNTIEKRVEKTEKRVSTIQWLAIAGIGVTSFFSLYSAWSLYHNALEVVNSYTAERDSLSARVETLEFCLSRPRSSACTVPAERLLPSEVQLFEQVLTPPPSEAQQ